MKKMKRIFVLLLGVLLVGVVQAQDKSDAMLFGDVKSTTTQEHIPYVRIAVKGTNMGTVADGTGHFKLAHLPVGKCVIVAQVIGYKTQEKVVVMEKGKAVQALFEVEGILCIGTSYCNCHKDKHHLKMPIRTEIISSEAIENKNASNICRRWRNSGYQSRKSMSILQLCDG